MNMIFFLGLFSSLSALAYVQWEWGEWFADRGPYDDLRTEPEWQDEKVETLLVSKLLIFKALVSSLNRGLYLHRVCFF